MSRRIYIHVPVDLGDIDTEDLKEELQSRNGKPDEKSLVPPLSSEERHPLHEIYYALKFGLDERAIGLMRSYINDELGTAL